LQRDLDRERARRERQNAANESDAKVASEIKAEKLADKRMHGGSRFNLRWSGSIPADQLTPEAVMKVLSDYIDFGALQAAAATPPTQTVAPSADSAAATQPASPTAQLKRGMSVDDVTKLLGQGRQLSASTTSDGLKTQVFEYLPGDRRVEVTYVEGLVVRFTISSR
jgi:hypothetical protein